MGWLRCCTTTALEILGCSRMPWAPQGSRQGLGGACPRCRSTSQALAVPEGPWSWLKWGQPARSPVLQLHKAPVHFS